MEGEISRRCHALIFMSIVKREKNIYDGTNEYYL